MYLLWFEKYLEWSIICIGMFVVAVKVYVDAPNLGGMVTANNSRNKFFENASTNCSFCERRHTTRANRHIESTFTLNAK